LDEQGWRLSSRGQIEGIETSPRIAVKDADGTILIDRRLAGEVQDIRTGSKFEGESFELRHG
jgi:hypothetical protein